jgi:hypothetical protein
MSSTYACEVRLCLLAYELTHYLNQRKRGRNGVAAIKLDMSKAYDRVEWHFLHMMMLKLGFTDQWVSQVMKCVTSVRYHIKINEEYTTRIIPQRGLRRGDSLSPYLFILCAEGLSAMLQKTEMDGKSEVIRVCREATRINHLFFADDSLILMRGNKNDAQRVEKNFGCVWKGLRSSDDKHAARAISTTTIHTPAITNC